MTASFHRPYLRGLFGRGTACAAACLFGLVVVAGPAAAQDCIVAPSIDLTVTPRQFLITMTCGATVRETGPTLKFTPAPGQTVLVGASLTNSELGIDTPNVDQRDHDFPLRIVRIDRPEFTTEWKVLALDDTVDRYNDFLVQVWNPEALVDCFAGRDGCRKYGYALDLDIGGPAGTDRLLVALK